MQDEHTALDIVQDSMTKLVTKYSDKPPEEFPLLFQTILQNTIRDHYRRQKTRSLWTTLFSSFIPEDKDGNQDDFDILDSLLPALKEDWNVPETQLERQQLINIIEDAIKTLPTRQREAFLLRYWEEMNLAETAEIMNCSQGSVKTHCSRAVHTLAKLLKERGVTL